MSLDRGARGLVIAPFGARHTGLDVFSLRPEQLRVDNERA